jgi:hypothetical protein
MTGGAADFLVFSLGEPPLEDEGEVELVREGVSSGASAEGAVEKEGMKGAEVGVKREAEEERMVGWVEVALEVAAVVFVSAEEAEVETVESEVDVEKEVSLPSGDSGRPSVLPGVSGSTAARRLEGRWACASTVGERAALGEDAEGGGRMEIACETRGVRDVARVKSDET